MAISPLEVDYPVINRLLDKHTIAACCKRFQIPYIRKETYVYSNGDFELDLIVFDVCEADLALILNWQFMGLGMVKYLHYHDPESDGCDHVSVYFVGSGNVG